MNAMQLARLGLAAAVAAAPSTWGAAAQEDSVVDLSGVQLATPTPEQQEALDRLPDGLRPYYVGYWIFAPLGPNPYADWTPPEPPYQFCYNESYQGNSWRQDALAKYEALVEQARADGLAEGELLVTNSNNDANLQLSQLNNLVRQGCDVILSIPSSPTGLCSGVRNARDAGALFIAVESPVNCPEAINVGLNEYFVAAKTAKWVADEIGGDGSVILVNGIPGLAPTVARRQAALDVLENYPDIELIGEVEGQWTPSTIKTNTLKFLATHPQPIEGVIDSGLGSVPVWQAFEQFGKPRPVVNGFGGECSFMAYAKENDLPVFSTSQSGATAILTGFDVAMRMLEGADLVANTLLMPLPEITKANFDEWYEDDMTLQSSCFADPPDGRRVSDAFLDQYFQN